MFSHSEDWQRRNFFCSLPKLSSSAVSSEKLWPQQQILFRYLRRATPTSPLRIPIRFFFVTTHPWTVFCGIGTSWNRILKTILCWILGWGYGMTNKKVTKLSYHKSKHLIFNWKLITFPFITTKKRKTQYHWKSFHLIIVCYIKTQTNPT